jgi:protein subunit release factor B
MKGQLIMAKELLFSVTKDDCEWTAMTAGGPGGQNQNRRHTAVRCVHRPSGAVGESREQNSQVQNKRAAFERMAQSKKFQQWVRIEAARRMGQKTPEQIVDELMQPEKLKVECRTADGWEECNVKQERGTQI